VLLLLQQLPTGCQLATLLLLLRQPIALCVQLLLQHLVHVLHGPHP
jgi:hypothetical protein